MKIGIFDSGIGGLTVLRKLVRNYSNCEYIYVGDTLNVPYGNKSIEQLLELSVKIIDYLISRKVDKIVIACGTISSNLGDVLKNNYKLPIIDVITPTTDYIINNKYRKIGILATSMTIRSNIFLKKLSNENIDIIPVECPKLVPAIESFDNNKVNECLKEYLTAFKDKDIDLIVLGCTHYPIVKNNIEKILLNTTDILDMAEPIVDMFPNEPYSTGLVELNFTKLDENILQNVKMVLGNDIKYKVKNIELK